MSGTLQSGWRTLCVLALTISVAHGADDNRAGEQTGKRTGEQIYQQLCASCHGPAGAGVIDQYPQPLAGDRSVGELADYIDRTMPEAEPELCVGEDAQAVAAYIHQAFYSPIARARNQPPRIEPARLTVRQYRHVIADLLSNASETKDWTTERGLKAEYFKSRRMRQEDRVIERIDPRVQADYAEGSPDMEQIEPTEFSIRWSGAIYAPNTGEYEFHIRSENGVRLWINDDQEPLIDGSVKSGDIQELQESVTLLGGRIYPLRLEMFKSKEAKEKRASVTLKWKPPHQVVEVIPERHLLPMFVPETFIVHTPFPPDDRSEGYERGNAISKAWEQATTDAALEIADSILNGRRRGRRDDEDGQRERLQKRCQQLVTRAFRRPITDAERDFFVDRHFTESETLEIAVKKSVLLTLKSPRFLFRDVEGDGQTSPYTIASRLSFALWDSLPDDPLLQAAARDELQTPEQIRQHAERMLADPRARAKLREFFQQWLRMEHLTDLAKNSEQFSDFTPEVIADLRTSLELSLDEFLASQPMDFRQLLVGDGIYLNGRLAQFYQAPLHPDADFQKVSWQPDERAGLLTHPFMMAGFAYTATTSPIHRGVFIARSVLGRTLRPPPEAVTPLPPELHADLTTRQRVELQTKPESCQSCHTVINPLGFPFENFDAVGRFRVVEQEKPIDASGGYLTRQGQFQSFANVRDLARFLADSEEPRTALATQLFHHTIKQPVRAYGLQTPEELGQQFAEQGCDVRQLLLAIVVKAALYTPPTSDTTTTSVPQG